MLNTGLFHMTKVNPYDWSTIVIWKKTLSVLLLILNSIKQNSDFLYVSGKICLNVFKQKLNIY